MFMVLWKVVRKWLNLKSRVDDFNSDCTSAAAGDRRTDKKGWKVWSGAECFVPIKGDDSGTWNVGGKRPEVGVDLKDWTQAHNFPPDLYIFGKAYCRNVKLQQLFIVTYALDIPIRFQEIVPLNAANVLGVEDDNPATKWLSLIRQVLNSGGQGDQDASHNIKSVNNLCPKYGRIAGDKSRICSSDMLFLNESSQIKEQSSSPKTISGGEPVYCLAASRQMVGILLCVWVRAEIYQQITNLKLSCVGTGIMSCMGNKGSVSMSMTLYHTSFCFVCTHLASGEKENDRIRRNHDVLEILNRTNFLSSRKSLEIPSFPSHILEHDNIFWLGDLNYRSASGYDDTPELLKKHEWQSLLERDQLLVEQRVG